VIRRAVTPGHVLGKFGQHDIEDFERAVTLPNSTGYSPLSPITGQQNGLQETTSQTEKKGTFRDMAERLHLSTDPLDAK